MTTKKKALKSAPKKDGKPEADGTPGSAQPEANTAKAQQRPPQWHVDQVVLFKDDTQRKRARALLDGEVSDVDKHLQRSVDRYREASKELSGVEREMAGLHQAIQQAKARMGSLNVTAERLSAVIETRAGDLVEWDPVLASSSTK